MALTPKEFETLKIRLAAQNGTTTSSVQPTNNLSLIRDTLQGKTTFPASMGGITSSSIPVNSAKAIGNIPSSAIKMAAPVNPFDSDGAINIGGNIAKSAVAAYDIAKSGAGIVDGTKSILGGFADTYLKIGEKIYGGLDKAYNALLDDPKKAMADTLEHVAKIGIEDPLFIPTLMYGSGKIVAGKDGISSAANTITRGADTSLANIGNKTVQMADNVASEVVNTAKTKVKPAAEYVANKITPIEQGVETVFNTSESSGIKMSEKFNKYIKQAEEAVKDYSKPTPLELAGDEASNALTQINNKLKNVGESKSKIAETFAEKPVGTMAQEAAEKFNEIIGTRVGITIKNGKLTKIPGRAITVSDQADLRLIRDAYNKLNSLGENPSFRMVDDTVDYLQDLLFKRSSNLTIPVNTKVEGALRGVVSKLNKSLQEVGGDAYKLANKRYSSIREVRDTLNKALGIDGNKGASLMKQLFSPSGTAPRKLFKEIKELTGIDLVEEATLAKFVMEYIGDVRQASLLEQVLKGGTNVAPKSLINRAIDFTLEKIQDPVKKANSIIKKRIDGESSFKSGAVRQTANVNNIREILSQMYETAPAAKTFIDTLADDLAQRYGSTVAKTKLKGMKRAEEKLLGDFGGDTTRLTDIARNTIVVPDQKTYIKVMQELAARKDMVDYKNVLFKDTPLGYTGGQVKIKTPNGHVAEIQINVPDLIFAKETAETVIAVLGQKMYDSLKLKYKGIEGGLGHKFYEQFRSLTREEQVGKIGQGIAEKSRNYYKKFSSK